MYDYGKIYGMLWIVNKKFYEKTFYKRIYHFMGVDALTPLVVDIWDVLRTCGTSWEDKQSAVRARRGQAARNIPNERPRRFIFPLFERVCMSRARQKFRPIHHQPNKQSSLIWTRRWLIIKMYSLEQNIRKVDWRGVLIQGLRMIVQDKEKLAGANTQS